MAHFHMTYNQVLWGVPWSVMQIMLADQPSYSTKKEKEKVIEATKDDIIEFIKRKNKEI